MNELLNILLVLFGVLILLAAVVLLFSLLRLKGREKEIEEAHKRVRQDLEEMGEIFDEWHKYQERHGS